MGFSSLPACRITQTSHSHPREGTRGHLTLLILAESASLCPVLFTMFAGGRTCVVLYGMRCLLPLHYEYMSLKKCCLYPLFSVGCCVSGYSYNCKVGIPLSPMGWTGRDWTGDDVTFFPFFFSLYSLLRFVLCPKIWSVLVNVPWTFEKDVDSAFVGSSVL